VTCGVVSLAHCESRLGLAPGGYSLLKPCFVIGSACRIVRPSFPFILTSPGFLFHLGCSYAGTNEFSQADCINEAVEAIPLRPELADVLSHGAV
jgi:hypothetical protein